MSGLDEDGVIGRIDQQSRQMVRMQTKEWRRAGRRLFEEPQPVAPSEEAQADGQVVIGQKNPQLVGRDLDKPDGDGPMRAFSFRLMMGGGQNRTGGTDGNHTAAPSKGGRKFYRQDPVAGGFQNFLFWIRRCFHDLYIAIFCPKCQRWML